MITHRTHETHAPEHVARGGETCPQRTSTSALRGRTDVERLFRGLSLVVPGAIRKLRRRETRGVTGAGLARFARAWMKGVAHTSFIPMDGAEMVDFLHRLASRLAALLCAEPFDSEPGFEIGTDLVAAHFAAPAALGHTIEIMHTRLLSDLGLSTEEMRRRLVALSGALAAGHACGLRDRALDKQDAIRRAAAEARKGAEQAVRDSEARFRYAALHDRLTGLPNRSLFINRLEQMFADAGAGTRVGLCFVDLDGFSTVNDSRGHHVGDQLLIATAGRLAELAANSGHLVARLSGDEFAVLIENSTCADDAVKVADRVLSVLGAPFQVAGHELPITASIGVVERPLTGTSPTEVMRAADITLHWAKDDGKGRWALFNAERSEHQAARNALSAAMPSALSRGEFTLAYQPMVGLIDGVVRGVEALARWHHPRFGVLTADRFIDLAEDSGLILPLGIRMLEQACQQAAGWLGAGTDPPFVSVNLAVHQLRYTGLAGAVTALLDRTNLPPERLQLEITETALMGTDRTNTDTLRALADLGVRLAIDDFGTGYSNLAYLGALPVHELKLAATFVQRLRSPAAAAAAAIISALVGLGHTLGLTVTVEGIEEQVEADQLAELGCDVGQGWHFGHPVSARQVVSLMAAAGDRGSGRSQNPARWISGAHEAGGTTGGPRLRARSRTRRGAADDRA